MQPHHALFGPQHDRAICCPVYTGELKAIYDEVNVDRKMNGHKRHHRSYYDHTVCHDVRECLKDAQGLYWYPKGSIFTVSFDLFDVRFQLRARSSTQIKSKPRVTTIPATHTIKPGSIRFNLCERA